MHCFSFRCCIFKGNTNTDFIITIDLFSGVFRITDNKNVSRCYKNIKLLLFAKFACMIRFCKHLFFLIDSCIKLKINYNSGVDTDESDFEILSN